jgi:peptidoglycan hydrolase-like protein with peptidoglycan-binding domain
VPLNCSAQGTVTWLPSAGDVITQGGSLLRVDERSVVLLYGTLPMYRPLQVGTTGADVTQFKRALKALGYTGFTVDSVFSPSTAAAVKRWQRHLGVEETGAVEASRVVYAGGPIRVANLSVRVGASAVGAPYTYTGVTKVVTVDVPAGGTTWATKGNRVTVAVPGGRTVAGEIAVVGTEASTSDSGGSGGDSGTNQGAAGATIPLTISIADQEGLRGLEKSPVDVRYTAQQRDNVLTVPVAALLALAEGGYGVEIVEGTNTRIVTVQTGLAADGRIEVRGDGLTEETIVGLAG